MITGQSDESLPHVHRRMGYSMEATVQFGCTSEACHCVRLSIVLTIA